MTYVIYTSAETGKMLGCGRHLASLYRLSSVAIRFINTLSHSGLTASFFDYSLRPTGDALAKRVIFLKTELCLASVRHLPGSG